MAERLVGVTVMPEYFQTEGVEAVLDRLIRDGGVTAIATSPYVMAPADEATGSREPPIDAGAGAVRLLDRPLFGRRELFVRTAPSFTPEVRFYEGLRYRPAAPDALTAEAGGIVEQAIRAAKARGLQVHLQVQAAIPPGYRVQFGGPGKDDQPRLPNGDLPTPRVDRNGSLASPHIRAYGVALMRDLLRAYPEVDAIRIDWPEVPPYSFDSLFLDFSDHAMAAAGRLGLDALRMRDDCAALRRHLLEQLEAGDLAPYAAKDGGRARLVALLLDHPGVQDLLRLKAMLALELVALLAEPVKAAGKRLVAHAFPPPWALVSGLDYRRVGHHADEIGVKLYTMHWPMMLRQYGDVLRAARPQLDPAMLGRALAGILDIADDDGLPLDAYHYPEPEEAHPVGRMAQARKIEEARARAGACPVHAMAHAYGPLDDVRLRLSIAYAAAGGRVWVNRYGYMSDAKIQALGEVTRS